MPGVDIAVLPTGPAYTQGSAFPGACDAGVTLQPNVAYSSNACTANSPYAYYVLIWRPNTNTMPLCRVDVMSYAIMPWNIPNGYW